MPYHINQIPNRTPLALIFEVVKIESRNIKFLYVYAIFSGIISLALPLGIQTIIGYVDGFKFHKVISTYMEFYNKHKQTKMSLPAQEKFLTLLGCFCPGFKL
jgi:hypothetical protein